MAGRGASRTAVPGMLVVLLGLAAACGGQDGGVTARREFQAAAPPSTTIRPGSAGAGSAAPAPSGRPTRAQLDRVAVRLERVARLDGAIVLAASRDGTTLYVGQRAGRVRAIRGDRLVAEPLVDVSKEVQTRGEGGLLGLAEAPDGRHLYLTFTDRRRAVRLIEFALGGGDVDPASRREVLTVPQTSSAHHGGNLVFGPDGLLWLGLGDGSHPGGDPHGFAQSLGDLRGKMLRIDPRRSGTAAYTAPADNPFARRRGARPEVWASGLRNPWRFSFDRATRDLWIGDVGQYSFEEIDAVPTPRGAGANFGWNRLEGRSRFRGAPPPGAVAPVHTYGRRGGRCAVIGGHVYRGTRIQGLQGAYVYGDVCDNGIRALVRTPGKALLHRDFKLALPGLVSFAEDRAGELYALSLDSGVHRLVAVG